MKCTTQLKNTYLSPIWEKIKEISNLKKLNLWDCSRTADKLDWSQYYVIYFHGIVALNKGPPRMRPILWPEGIYLKDHLCRVDVFGVPGQCRIMEILCVQLKTSQVHLSEEEDIISW